MNNTPHFKLKFKIEVLEKLQKSLPLSSGNHRTYFEEFQMIKMSEHSSNHKLNSNNSLSNSNYGNNKNIGVNSSKNKHSKYSVRNSKFFTGDIDSLPGYAILTSDISQEEKEELLRYIKSSDSGNTLFQSFHLIYSKRYYSKIKCKNGTNIITNIFKELVKKYKEGNFSEIKNESKSNINNKNVITENLNERNRDNDINYEIENEIELYMVLRNVMELNDIDSYEIFNMFKYNETFTFTEKHFMYLFYLFSSFECNAFNDFITLFGDELFEELSSNEKVINVSRMRTIGEILNIPTKEMNNTLQELKLYLYTPINQEKFMAFYLNLSKKYSSQNNLNINEANNLLWNIGNVNNNNLNNNYINGFSMNKNISNKLKENNYSQNIGHTTNKIYTMGSFNRKDNSHVSSVAFNQKRQFNNFNGNFKSKEKLNKLTKKIHYKK